MKIADLSHVMAPFELHRLWSERLEEELFQQVHELNLCESALTKPEKPMRAQTSARLEEDDGC
jgi:hypothetical protein